MKEIVTNIPIQTRGETINQRGRLFPFLTAEAINRVKEYYTGKIYPRVDVWNTFGSKTERDFHRSSVFETIGRHEYFTQQIKNRYDFLKTFFGIDSDNRYILRDDDETYQEIATRYVATCVNTGIFIVRNEKFSHCQPCNYSFALSAAKIKRCPSCGGAEISEIEKRGLFAYLTPADKKQIVECTAIFPSSARKTLKRVVLSMPETIQISRQREFGISLSLFDTDESFVLDPKITVAMMGKVIRDLELGSVATLIQGVDSLGNTVPYNYLVDQDTRPSYVAIGLLSQLTANDINEQNRFFYFPFLALSAVSLTEGITPERRIALLKEYNRTINRFEYALSQLNRAHKEGINEEIELNAAPLNEVFKLFWNYRIREGLLLLRQFIYEDMSKKYLADCKEKGCKPNRELLKKVEVIMHLFYG